MTTFQTSRWMRDPCPCKARASQPGIAVVTIGDHDRAFDNQPSNQRDEGGPFAIRNHDQTGPRTASFDGDQDDVVGGSDDGGPAGAHDIASHDRFINLDDAREWRQSER